MSSCSCIIPFYNEGERILSVLSELSKVKEFDEIILVNDGSTDNWWNVVKDYIKNFSHIKLIEYPRNHWKSYAVKQWLSQVKSDYVFFFDADLQWVKKMRLSMLSNRYIHIQKLISESWEESTQSGLWGYLWRIYFYHDRECWKHKMQKKFFPEKWADIKWRLQ